jgi:hypothetical protein
MPTTMTPEKTDPELTAKDDLGIAWQKVIENLDETATWKSKEKRYLTVTDVIHNIQPEKEVPEITTSKVKKFAKTTLICIQRFGDVVATASAVAFPASQQCFKCDQSRHYCHAEDFRIF